MFLTFFYLLRASGINVSLSEWLTLMEGLRMDLHDSTLSGFYTLCRSVLLHSEADFDRFDQVFLEFFKELKHVEEVPPEMLKWLEHPELDLVELERTEWGRCGTFRVLESRVAADRQGGWTRLELGGVDTVI